MRRLFNEADNILLKKLDAIASKYGFIKVTSNNDSFLRKYISTYTTIEYNKQESDPMQLEIGEMPDIITEENASDLDDIIVDISNAKDCLEEMISAVNNDQQ